MIKYDAWNRLVEVKNTGGAVVATYRYDGANRRVTFYDGTNTRHYYYSDEWQVLEERLNSASAYDQRYVFGLRYLDDLILRDDGGTRHYCLSDYFSITAIINTSGAVLERYTYDAFGKPTYLTGAWGARGSSSYSWETLYASYRYDTPTGLYQVRNRYLHPNLGRWISRDPLGDLDFGITQGGEFDPLGDGTNLYAYVKNNAVNHVDIDGLGLAGCIRAIRKWQNAMDVAEKKCAESAADYQALMGCINEAIAQGKCCPIQNTIRAKIDACAGECPDSNYQKSENECLKAAAASTRAYLNMWKACLGITRKK